MTDFVVAGKPFETPEGAADLGYLQTPPTLEQTLVSGAGETTGAIGRFLGESLYDPHSLGGFIGRDIIAGTEIEGGLPPDQQVVPPDLSALPGGPDIPAEQINKQAGAHITDKPINQTLANLLIDAKKREQEREQIWSRFANAHSWPTNMAVGMGAFLADPLNIGTLFVPGIGEEAILGRLGTSLAARMVASGAATAAGATVAQLPLTALKYGIGLEESSDYDLRQAFLDLAMNAGAGAIFGAGFGGLGYWLRGRGLPEPPAAREEKPGVATEAARILDADATTSHAALGTAVSQLIEGKPVEVESFFPSPPETQTAVGQLYIPHETIPDAEMLGHDVQQVARQLEPDLFREQDRLEALRDTYRRWIDELSAGREKPPQIGAIDSEIARLQDRIQNATPRLTKKYQARIEELNQTRDQVLASLPLDTPDMARIRQLLGDTDLRLRDLAAAGQLADAVDRARKLIAIHTGAEMGTAAEREAARQAEFMRPRVVWPSDIVARERALRRSGYASGRPQSEVDVGNAALAEHQQQPPPTPEPEAKPPEGWGKPAAAEPTTEAAPAEPKPAEGLSTTAPAADPEIAAAEARFAAAREGKPVLLPEEQADLDAARAAMQQAELTDQALQEAASCLTEAGM